MSKGTKNKKWRIKWTEEKVMSISALFVSAISLFALFHQLNLAREENELIRKQQSASVLPHLSYYFSGADNNFSFAFVNRGVGPAFIKEVKVVINDSLIFYNTDKAIQHIIKSNFNDLDSVSSNGNFKIRTSTFKKGNVLPANQSISIVIIKIGEISKIMEPHIRKMKYEVTYEDVYGTRWKLDTKKDESFPELISAAE